MPYIKGYPPLHRTHPLISNTLHLRNLLLMANLFAVFAIFSLFSLSAQACGPCGTPSPKPKPKPVSPPASKGFCPKDTLKIGTCVDLLGLVNVVIGTPPTNGCCALLSGLADLEAAVCLCTAIKANVLGINLDIPVALSLLLSACQKSVPKGFQCA